MPENKTKATDASVEDYFSAISDEARRTDCRALAKVMTKATKQPPSMWGTSIHKRGKGCLYLRTLTDVDLNVLEQLIVGSVAQRKRHYA
jgi:hypothetical protein